MRYFIHETLSEMLELTFSKISAIEKTPAKKVKIHPKIKVQKKVSRKRTLVHY